MSRASGGKYFKSRCEPLQGYHFFCYSLLIFSVRLPIKRHIVLHHVPLIGADFSTQRGRKICAKMAVLNLSVLPYIPHTKEAARKDCLKSGGDEHGGLPFTAALPISRRRGSRPRCVLGRRRKDAVFPFGSDQDDAGIRS